MPAPRDRSPLAFSPGRRRLCRGALTTALLLATGLATSGTADAAGLPPPKPAPGTDAAQAEAGERFVWPTSGTITTYFGEVGPYSPRGHAGLDIAAPGGTPIYAAASGRVALAGSGGDGYGTQVLVEHAGDLVTRYAHLSALHVRAGDQVRRGQLIGLMGSTGYSTGPHLHFEIIQAGALRDPLAFLP